MRPETFSNKQAAQARLAQALREMIPHAADIKLAEMTWPADNVRFVLGEAADLIDELTLLKP